MTLRGCISSLSTSLYACRGSWLASSTTGERMLMRGYYVRKYGSCSLLTRCSMIGSAFHFFRPFRICRTWRAKQRSKRCSHGLGRLLLPWRPSNFSTDGTGDARTSACTGRSSWLTASTKRPCCAAPGDRKPRVANLVGVLASPASNSNGRGGQNHCGRSAGQKK